MQPALGTHPARLGSAEGAPPLGRARQQQRRERERQTSLPEEVGTQPWPERSLVRAQPLARLRRMCTSWVAWSSIGEAANPWPGEFVELMQTRDSSSPDGRRAHVSSSPQPSTTVLIRGSERVGAITHCKSQAELVVYGGSGSELVPADVGLVTFAAPSPARLIHLDPISRTPSTTRAIVPAHLPRYSAHIA